MSWLLCWIFRFIPALNRGMVATAFLFYFFGLGSQFYLMEITNARLRLAVIFRTSLRRARVSPHPTRELAILFRTHWNMVIDRPGSYPLSLGAGHVSASHADTQSFCLRPSTPFTWHAVICGALLPALVALILFRFHRIFLHFPRVIFIFMPVTSAIRVPRSIFSNAERRLATATHSLPRDEMRMWKSGKREQNTRQRT